MPVVVDGVESFAPFGSDLCQYLSTNVRTKVWQSTGGQYSCDEQMAQGITGQILSGSHTQSHSLVI